MSYGIIHRYIFHSYKFKSVNVDNIRPKSITNVLGQLGANVFKYGIFPVIKGTIP
jgi:hypothetical protein